MRRQSSLLICCLSVTSMNAAAQNDGLHAKGTQPDNKPKSPKTTPASPPAATTARSSAPASSKSAPQKAAAPHPWRILWQSPFNKVNLKENGTLSIRFTPPAPANNPRDLKEEFVEKQLDKAVVDAIFAKAASADFLNSAPSYDPKPGSADIYRTIYTSADLFDSKGELIHRVRVSDKAVVKPPRTVQEILITIGELRAQNARPARKPEF